MYDRPLPEGEKPISAENPPKEWEAALAFTKKVGDELGLSKPMIGSPDTRHFLVEIFIALLANRS